VSLAFIDDGVFQLMAGQDTAAAGMKNFSRTFKALGDYDVHKFYVERESLGAPVMLRASSIPAIWRSTRRPRSCSVDDGIIVTRSSRLQAIFKSLGERAGKKYDSSTTHMNKLMSRIERGGGGGCPILAFGITQKKYVEDEAPITEQLATDE
jgi:hypothetical protein